MTGRRVAAGYRTEPARSNRFLRHTDQPGVVPERRLGRPGHRDPGDQALPPKGRRWRRERGLTSQRRRPYEVRRARRRGGSGAGRFGRTTRFTGGCDDLLAPERRSWPVRSLVRLLSIYYPIYTV